ncbi:hypothetical protein D3C77_684710 [compost metagenome]
MDVRQLSCSWWLAAMASSFAATSTCDIAGASVWVVALAVAVGRPESSVTPSALVLAASAGGVETGFCASLEASPKPSFSLILSNSPMAHTS